MPITTYIAENELKKYSQVLDKELNDLFQEVRAAFSNAYYLQEREFKINRGLFRKAVVKKLYSLYCDVGFDIQVINFAQDSESSLNTYVSASYIYTYFYGLLNGKKYADREATLQNSNE